MANILWPSLGRYQSACALVWRPPPPATKLLETYYAIDGQASGLMQKASSCLPKLPKAALRQDLCGMKWQNSQADFMSVAEKSTKKGLYSMCQGRFLRYLLKSQDLFTDLPSFSSAQQCRAGPSKSSDYATGLKCLLSVVLSVAILFDSVFLSRTIIDKKESSSAVLDTRDDLPLWR